MTGSAPIAHYWGKYVSRFAAPGTAPATLDNEMEELELLDWKRRVFALYAGVRAAGER